MFDIMRGAHKMDANILEKGRAALINYAYERRAVTVMKAMAEKAPSEELSKRIKTQAARARRTEAALLRLTGAEYVLLEGSYIARTGTACSPRRSDVPSARCAIWQRTRSARSARTISPKTKKAAAVKPRLIFPRYF